MSSAVRIGWILALGLCLLGCPLAPLGNYHTPEPLGEGNHCFGLAGTAAPIFTMNALSKSRGAFVTGGADVWFEHGLKKNRDMRYRFTFIPGGELLDSPDWVNFLIGLSFEYKSSNRSGSAAFLTGLSALLLVDTDDPDHLFPLFSPFFGGVFGIGEPGGIRLLLTPRMNIAFVPFAGLQAGFSVGLDLPVGGTFTVRPEAGINIGFLTLLGDEENEWAIPIWGGFGMAMIF
jgi:hypothetical protein